MPHPCLPPITESMKSLPSDGTRTSEWVLVSVTGSSGLGTPERLKKLENVKQRRTEHGETVITIQQLLYTLVSPLSFPHRPISHFEERFQQLLTPSPSNHITPLFHILAIRIFMDNYEKVSKRFQTNLPFICTSNLCCCMEIVYVHVTRCLKFGDKYSIYFM